MAKMMPLLIRLKPEHIARLDTLRGDVPRVAFIRSRLVAMLDGGPAEKAARTDKAGWTARAIKSIAPVDPLTGEPLPERKPMQKGEGKKR